jgi:hypothetical protein
MEHAMYKSLVTISAALAIVSLGMLACDRAQAGSSSSAPSKYQAVHTANQTQFKITEFSSSSAKRHGPQR